MHKTATCREWEYQRLHTCTINIIDLLKISGWRSKHVEELILCNLYKILCIKLVSIKELYYDARPTKSQKKRNSCLAKSYVVHFVVTMEKSLINSSETMRFLSTPWKAFSVLWRSSIFFFCKVQKIMSAIYIILRLGSSNNFHFHLTH